MTGAPVQAKLRLALDEHLKVLSVSDGIEALLGFSAEDFLAFRVSVKDRIHKDDAAIAGMLFSSPIENKSGTFNIRLRHADGRIRCIKGQYSKEPANEGGAVLDLLLQDAKSLYESRGEPTSLTTIGPLMDIVDEALYFKDRNYVFTGGNRQSILAFAGPGGDGAGFLGKTDYDLFPEEYADIYYRLEREVFEKNAVASELQVTLTPDGGKRWVDNRKYPIRNKNGEIIGLFGVAQDITVRMDALERLRESEDSLREAQSIADRAAMFWRPPLGCGQVRTFWTKCSE